MVIYENTYMRIERDLEVFYSCFMLLILELRKRILDFLQIIDI